MPSKNNSPSINWHPIIYLYGRQHFSYGQSESALKHKAMKNKFSKKSIQIFTQAVFSDSQPIWDYEYLTLAHTFISVTFYGKAKPSDIMIPVLVLGFLDLNLYLYILH